MNLTPATESEKLYQNLFEKNPSGIYIYNSETYQILDVNEAAIISYGYTKDEFLRMTLKDLISYEDLHKLESAVKNLVEDYKVGIWRHVKKNGEIITVEIKSVRIMFKGTNAVISIPNDITEKVRKEEEINKLNANLILLNENLKNNEARLQAAQEAAKIGYWEYNFTNELYYISDELYKIFGIEFIPGPVKRSSLTAVVHPDDLHIVRNAVLNAKQYGEFNYYIYRLIEKDGGIKYIYTKGEVIKAKDGSSEKIVGISMDITEREKTRLELQHHTDNINLILRSITDIFYIVDREYNILFANHSVEMLTGLSNDALIGKNVWKVFEDAELSLPKKEFYKALEENKASIFEMDYQGRVFRVHLYPSETGLAVTGRDVTDNVKVQEELSRQLENVDIILKSITEPFFILDNDYSFIFANEAIANLTGYKLEDLLAKKLWPAFTQQSEDFTNLRRGLESSMKKKVPSKVEFTYKGRFFYTHIYPSKIGLAVSCADITSRKKAEEELKNNAKFIKEISDTMAGVIFQTEYDKDFNAKFNYISPKANEFTGYTAEELLADYNKHLSSIHPEDLQNFNEARKNITELKSFTVKYRYLDKNTSETKWVRVTAIPSRLSNGNIIVNGILLDISESEKHYSELEQSNQRYEYISKASNEAIWEIDLNTNEITFGGDYERIFGVSYPGNKCHMDDTTSLTHPDDAERVIREQTNVFINREKYWESQYRNVRGDNSIIFVHEKAFVIYDEKKGRPVKIIGTTRDITQIKKAEMEREKIIADLMKRNKALEEFTYMVSHNIRAPLANIMGLSTMLGDINSDDKTLLGINKMIIASSFRLDEVVKDINEILSITKSVDEEKRVIKFETILNEIKSMEKHAINKSGIKILSDFENCQSMVAVKSYIISIFHHLISNSIKFKKENSAQIKISSHDDKEFIYITFEDNGIGFDSVKNKDKVFGLYNRFHPEKEGKGMGLYIVSKHVENLGGEITVESETDKGTKFIIKFKK